MIDLTPKLFLIPIIGLLFVIVGCFYLSKRTTNGLFPTFILILIIIGFVLNFIWELLHSPLYVGYINNTHHVLISALASVADALMSIFLYACFAFIFKNPFWIKFLIIKRAVLVGIVGGMGAIVSEMLHVSGGDWAYGPAMPIIPFLNVGLSPVLQFIMLPLSSYFFGFYLLKFGNRFKALK